MAQPKNAGKQWTPEDNKAFEKLAKGNTPTRVIALKLGRTEGSIQNHAGEIRVSLKPVNQPPYGTQKKK